jgi:hypothetical protein
MPKAPSVTPPPPPPTQASAQVDGAQAAARAAAAAVNGNAGFDNTNKTGNDLGAPATATKSLFGS